MCRAGAAQAERDDVLAQGAMPGRILLTDRLDRSRSIASIRLESSRQASHGDEPEIDLTLSPIAVERAAVLLTAPGFSSTEVDEARRPRQDP